MTDYLGTSDIDFFAGADGVADTFFFRPLFLSDSDTVTGGRGAGVTDTLSLTRNGIVSAAQLVGVSGVEQVQLFGNNSLTLTFDMLATARGKTISVIGSNTNDTVDGSLATSANMKVKFTARDGADSFIGGVGDDEVSIGAGRLTIADALSGGSLGQDTLIISTAGDLASDALTHVSSFETIKFDNGGNSITLSTSNVTSAHGGVRVLGGPGRDVVDAISVTSGKVVFSGGDGVNFFDGGAGNDTATGGNWDDGFFGGAGNDTLVGGDGGYDSLIGDAGDDTIYGGMSNGHLYGGDGVDTIVARIGFSFVNGDAGSDIITVAPTGSTLAAIVAYEFESEGGDAGDTIRGLSAVNVGDIRLWFHTGSGDFGTNGAFDFKVFDDGTAAIGSGGPTDGADAVFYDGNLEGSTLGSAEAVDTYFRDRYFAADNVGAFLAEMNPDGSVTVYYDADAHGGFGGVVTLTHIENYAGTIQSLMGYFDAS